MNIGIIGSGYVGLVAAACFAEMGNTVVCVDIDQNKIGALKNGIIPIYEPGLEPLVKNNFAKNSLLFTTNINDALEASNIVFIAVGSVSFEGMANIEADTLTNVIVDTLHGGADLTKFNWTMAHYEGAL